METDMEATSAVNDGHNRLGVSVADRVALARKCI